MRNVRPKPLGAPVTSMRLTPEEGFVLSRIDGTLSVRDLVALTGLDEPRVEQIVTRLAQSGAVALEGAPPSSRSLPESSPRMPAAHPASPATTRDSSASWPDMPPQDGTASLADFAAALGMDPTTFAASRSGAAVEAPVDASRARTISSFPGAGEPQLEEVAELEEVHDDEPASDVLPVGEAVREPSSSTQLVSEDAAPADDAGETGEAAADAAEATGEGDAAAEGDGLTAEDENNYRKIYETRFHSLATDARVHLATTSHGPDLLALCFDADPRVISAVLHNPTVGLQHGRLIAFHHRNGTGLEILSRRMEFLRDVMIERRLLRNPQCGEQVLSRIMASKRLHQTYKIAIDREIPELTRARGRGYIRTKFQQAPSEERADLVLRTEGRCLVVMVGCTFDAKTTAILVGKQYNSVLFIQNFAKWAATPPALLAHLVKQPFVRKIIPLKRLLLQHPNMPGEVKRQLS